MESQRTPLAVFIDDRILESGPVPVAQFMDWALYHPQYGYYSRGPKIGPRGDFTTSPETSPAFGKLLARHIAEVDALLGSPERFELVEFGPGRGTLARDLLDELASTHPDLYSRIYYCLVEISPSLSATQKAMLLPAHAARVAWQDHLRENINLTGAVIANEFVDAFPVHVLELVGGELCEQYVDVSDGEFRIIHLPPLLPALVNFRERSGLTLEEGEKVEVNLAAGDWIRETAAAFSACVALIIDYGDVAPARYSAARKQGTLLGYHQGKVTDEILAHPGEQDLTALVDFSALQDYASLASFQVMGMTRQASFLVGLGLGAVGTEEAANVNLDQALKERRGVHSLISMEGLGRFHVLILSKGIDATDAARGLSGLRFEGIL